MIRYKVSQHPVNSRAWVILDRLMWGYCALPDPQTAEIKELRFASEGLAERWMTRCYREWEKWGDARAPVFWRPMPPGEISPWEYDPSYPPDYMGPLHVPKTNAKQLQELARTRAAGKARR